MDSHLSHHPHAAVSSRPSLAVTLLGLALAVVLALGSLPALAQGLRSGLTPDALLKAPVVGGANIGFPAISAQGAIVYDADAKVILGSHAPTDQRYIASTTKMMTVLLAMEALERGEVSNSVTVSPTAVAGGAADPKSSSLKLKAGQVISLRDLLAADLLASGNDGAIAIAEHVSGTEAKFVERMNARAKELGLNNTHFVNSSGLTDDRAHTSTPLDLVLLGQEIISHPDIARWVQSVSLNIPGLGLVHNTNDMLTKYPGTIGIKTGFTTLAGQCLVAAAQRDGRTIFIAVLGSKDRVLDSSALFNFGFSNYKRVIGAKAGQEIGEYQLANGAIPIMSYEQAAATVPTTSTVLETRVLNPSVAPPIAAGQDIGTITLSVDGAVVATSPLRAGASIGVPEQDSLGMAYMDLLYAMNRITQASTVTVISKGPEAAPADPGYVVSTQPQGQ